MWRLGYYRGITWKMLNDPRNIDMKLNGKNHVTWQWTDYRLGKDYTPGDWDEAVQQLIPHNYIWAMVLDPDRLEKPTLLGTLFAKRKLGGGNIAMF